MNKLLTCVNIKRLYCSIQLKIGLILTYQSSNPQIDMHYLDYFLPSETTTTAKSAKAVTTTIFRDIFILEIRILLQLQGVVQCALSNTITLFSIWCENMNQNRRNLAELCLFEIYDERAIVITTIIIIVGTSRKGKIQANTIRLFLS